MFATYADTSTTQKWATQKAVLPQVHHLKIFRPTGYALSAESQRMTSRLKNNLY